jgi:predicted  nucleic acid-binding Zn ribbon protein
MLSVELTFATLSGQSVAVEDPCDDVVSCWYKNGQIETSRWHVIRGSNQVRIIASIPDTTALDERNNNVYAQNALDALAAHDFASPKVRVLGIDQAFDAPCVCAVRESLILYTTYLSNSTPVRCGTCFAPVPLYRLPHTRNEEHLDVLHWASDYRACDTLQMHCTTGERFAELQLYRYDSSLSRQGRGIAAELSKRLRVPVYYFLLTSRGTSDKSERTRVCPSCKGEWLLSQAWHTLFDFRCDRCSLVSNIACDLRV